VLGERMTARAGIALASGVAGTALLVGEPGATSAGAPRMVAGVLLALVAALAYALYVIVTKASLAHSAPLPLTAMTFVAAAVLMLPTLAWTDDPLRQVALGWPWLLYLGVVATAAAYALYATGLTLVPASVAGIVALAEPLTATLLGVVLFGERLGTLGAAGAALLLASLALVVTPRRA
jgi:DME family drug/metabolite transporter